MNIGKFTVELKEGDTVRVTWGADGIGERKDFVSDLKCVDATHLFGVVPFYRGVRRCSDLWHISYVPCDRSIKSCEKIVK